MNSTKQFICDYIYTLYIHTYATIYTYVGDYTHTCTKQTPMYMCLV